MDCNRIDDQLSPYLLGALGYAELRALDRHIDGCGRCQLRLREEGEITEKLTYDAPQVAPPARVKQRLVSRIEADQGRRLVGTGVPTSGLLAGFSFSFGTYSGMAAASLVVLLLVLGGAWANGRLNEVTAGKQALVLQVDAPGEASAASPYQAYPTFPAATRGPAVEELVATRRSDGARGMLLAPRTGSTAHVAAFGLPPLPVGLVYRVWVEVDLRRYDAGSFTVDSTGYGYVDLRLPTALTELDSITVTVERANGDREVDSNTTTTGKAVLRGDL